MFRPTRKSPVRAPAPAVTGALPPALLAEFREAVLGKWELLFEGIDVEFDYKTRTATFHPTPAVWSKKRNKK